MRPDGACASPAVATYNAAMIRLRPYYLFTVFRQLDAGDRPADDNSLPQITARLAAGGFQEDIRLVRGFCDACEGCAHMQADPAGCLWGEGYRCASTATAKRLNQVEDQMRSILYDLEMTFGQHMRADKLLRRAAERRPFHYFHLPDWQAAYERGVRRFADLTGLRPEVPADLLAQRKHYFRDDD